MIPAITLITMLQNAILTCQEETVPNVYHPLATPVYKHGFEQCAYLVPAANKFINNFFNPPDTRTPAQKRAERQARIARAVAALVEFEHAKR